MEERLVDSVSLPEDNEEIYLRPTRLNQYIGQEKAKENLDIFIKAAKRRNESLDHILLYGPPGLGKTTLANIIAKELSVGIKHTTGPMLERSGDLAAILSSVSPGDVLFIDEIHRLSKNIEEILYSAMEDYCLDIIVGKDASARNMRIELPPFTLIGATTRIGDLSNPLRDRFGVQTHLEYYNKEELNKIILRTAKVLSTKIDEKAAQELALRSRGTPRIANRLFKRIRDFSLILENSEYITLNLTNKALEKLDIDKYGLDLIDHKILQALCEKFNGGPVGIEALSATISEDAQTIEDVYEPFLLKEGFIARTRQGRILTKKGYLHLGLPYEGKK